MSNPELHIRVFNPDVKKDVDRLVELWIEYTVECMNAGELGSGTPVAPFLSTWLIMLGSRCVGMVSVDAKRVSVELIYIKQTHRGKGIASRILTEARMSAPGTFRLKGPLSPVMQHIAEKHGIEMAVHDRDSQGRYDETHAYLVQSFTELCPHTGDTVRMCRPCVARKLAPACRSSIEMAIREVEASAAFMKAARRTGLFA